MESKELEFLISEGESYNLEFKENFSDSIARDICAFANDNGGKNKSSYANSIGLLDNHKNVQIQPFNNLSANSLVVYTLTNDCFLRCWSLDQIAEFIDNDTARKSTSSGSDNKAAAFSRNSSYLETLMNSIDSSTSFCLISNSCSESLDLNKHSNLCFLISS